MAHKIPVIVNSSGGTARKLGDKLEPQLRAAFQAAGGEPDLALVEGGDIAKAIERARGAAVVAVGGGDGTQSGAAQVLAGSDTALAVLPLGTLNHLAKQIGVPADLEGAVKVAVSGRVERIDVARVGDIVFVNNASIGLYTRMVRHRDASRLPKWLATLPAAWTVLAQMKLKPICIDIGDGPQEIVSPLLFVGNNRYSYEGRTLGQRESMTDGVLSVYAVAPKTRAQLFGFAMRALVGRADPEHDFEALAEVEHFTVSGEGSIWVAHDGEVERMALPLEFRIMPRALAVMVPADAPATSGAAIEQPDQANR
ncbi:diacylglycerol/lipid kinase family protein [Novosphingobium lentum]|uniref:diacylglycerol/lipid kinase family protein n=1 Tax=Novosphingobium lentum TaxID=145287 RepID=UPI00082D2284|nr:diacylglycerol kinase family protein [Novosphingobium lentum]